VNKKIIGGKSITAFYLIINPVGMFPQVSSFVRKGSWKWKVENWKWRRAK